MQLLIPGVFATLLVAATLLAQTASKSKVAESKELRASRLILTDSRGRDRIRLSADEEAASIVVLDPSGKARLSVSVLKDGSAGFHIYDPSKRLLGEFASMADGTSQVVVYNRERTHSSMMAASQKGISGFGMYDAQDRTIAGLLLLEDGTRLLALSDRAAERKATLTIDNQDSPSLSLTSRDQRTRVIRVQPQKD